MDKPVAIVRVRLAVITSSHDHAVTVGASRGSEPNANVASVLKIVWDRLLVRPRPASEVHPHSERVHPSIHHLERVDLGFLNPREGLLPSFVVAVFLVVRNIARIDPESETIREGITRELVIKFHLDHAVNSLRKR